MSRATEAELDKMHAQVAVLLANELDRAAYRATLNPADPAQAVSPQLISQALKFLSNAGVTAPATAKRAENLASKLADLDLDLESVTGIQPN